MVEEQQSAISTAIDIEREALRVCIRMPFLISFGRVGLLAIETLERFLRLRNFLPRSEESATNTQKVKREEIINTS